MTAPPPKVKAFLASIKELVIDAAEPTDGLLMYLVLLRMELLHRGVLIPMDVPDLKVYEAVLASAGKPLVDVDSGFPKPLLAGISALSGRIAERCAQYIASTEIVVYLPKDPPSQQMIESAWQRCKTVQDDRLGTLLRQQQQQPPNQLQNGPDDIQSTTSIHWKHRLLLMAQGYYLRAASLLLPIRKEKKRRNESTKKER